MRPSNFELKLIGSNSKNTFKLHTLTNSFIWYRSFLFKAFSYRKTERQKSESQMAALKNFILTWVYPYIYDEQNKHQSITITHITEVSGEILFQLWINR